MHVVGQNTEDSRAHVTKVICAFRGRANEPKINIRLKWQIALHEVSRPLF